MKELNIVLIMIGFDILTGILKSMYKGQVNSFIGTKGWIKHSGVLLLAVFIKVVSKFELVEVDLSLMIHFLNTFYIVSIIENLIEMDVPIPDIIKDRFRKVKK